MRYGSKRQMALSIITFARLPRAERETVTTLAEHDELPISSYIMERHDGVLYADNGYSMVYDVTHNRNVEADSIAEAVAKVAA